MYQTLFILYSNMRKHQNFTSSPICFFLLRPLLKSSAIFYKNRHFASERFSGRNLWRLTNRTCSDRKSLIYRLISKGARGCHLGSSITHKKTTSLWSRSVLLYLRNSLIARFSNFPGGRKLEAVRREITLNPFCLAAIGMLRLWSEEVLCYMSSADKS